MKRCLTFFRDCSSTKDRSALILLTAIILASVVTVSILFCKPMVVAGFKRFQLASGSYPLWALHQCCPSMYNFENKVWFTNALDAPMNEFNSTGNYPETVNHFPARHITYGNLRGVQFADSDQAMFKMRSSFQGQSFTSVWRIEKSPEGVLRIDRVSQKLESSETIE